jgi:hypothetical protein
MSLKTLELMGGVRTKTAELGLVGSEMMDDGKDFENRLRDMRTDFERVARELDMMLPSLPRKWRKVQERLLGLIDTPKTLEEAMSSVNKKQSQ